MVQLPVSPIRDRNFGRTIVNHDRISMKISQIHTISISHLMKTRGPFKIYIISMKLLVILLTLFLFQTFSIVCEEPQRKFFLSYSSLAKRDALTNLFIQISAKLTEIQSTYTDAALLATFRIPGLKASAYYNDHFQREAYLDKLCVNVTMGDIVIASRFNYSVDYAQSSKMGIIEAKGRLDPSYFTKNLTNQQGFIEWKPDILPFLTFTQFFVIQYSDPSLNEAEKGTFTKMLNNQAGNRKIKTQIIDQINGLYVPTLMQHLNHQDLISTKNITYKYRNIAVNLQNEVKQYYISEGTTKGLEVFMKYGLESSIQNCTKLGQDFDQQQYGGFQEIISFGIIRSMVKQAINKGLYDISLNKIWEVQTFQFYMGDLGNFIPYANLVPAGERFNINCKYVSSESNEAVKITRYDQQEIYVSVPLSCELTYSGKPIIRINLDTIIIGQLIVLEKSINVVVRSTNMFGVNFTSIDQNYKVENVELGKYFVGQVLKGLVGQSVFGTGFQTMFRKLPAVRVLEDRTILFDPSQL